MDYAELLLQYNGFLLVFSATGFLISLVWVLITEKNKRHVDDQQKLSKDDMFDEKVFFGEFDNLENPAMKSNDLKPIFENILPSDSSHSSSLDSNGDESKTGERKFIKMNELPKFPTLKKEIEDTLDPKINDKQEVKGLLDEIKKDIKKNTKGKYKK